MGATSRSDASIKIVNGDHNAAAGRRRKKKSWKEFRRKRLSISNPLWIVSKATSGADDRFLCSSYYILITILSLSLFRERDIFENVRRIDKSAFEKSYRCSRIRKYRGEEEKKKTRGNVACLIFAEKNFFPQVAMQKERTKLEEWAEEGGICADQITQIKNKQRG